jgi:uncharacterized protein (DUF58 family)
MSTRLTLRAWGVLIGCVALLVAGQLLGYPMLRVLAGAGIAAVVISVLTVVRRPKVTVERVLYPDRVECGQPALARLMVRNESTRRQPAFAAVDTAGPHQSEVAVAALAPNGVATYHYAARSTCADCGSTCLVTRSGTFIGRHPRGQAG